MKLFYLLLLFPLFSLSQAKSGDALYNEGMKKYQSERGRITYLISGDADGEEVMVFAKHGWQSMRKQNMLFELYGIKTVQTLHEITDGDYVYRLNEGDSTFITKKDFKWSQQAAYKTPDETSEAILFSLGGTYVADSTLLNKVCQVWTFEGKALQELWIWNGLVLKRKTKLGDRIIFSTATELDLNHTSDAGVFNLPEHLKEKK